MASKNKEKCAGERAVSPYEKKMEEIWKNLEPPFNGYKISNFGRIKNAKNKESKVFYRKDRGYVYPFIHINLRRKSGNCRICHSLAQEVYKAFGENYKDGVKIYHKDGNVMNCCIDNLFIARGYTIVPSAEQLSVFNSDVIKCVLHFVGVKRLNVYGDLCDIDNVIGESYLMIWKHLSQFKVGKSFYSFCARYVQFAFLAEYKKKKQEKENIERWLMSSVR